ncbi:hypothetical protein GRI58_13750 [Porphyrobacter algicida]|uniref:Uncharacterized protein n=1 Tax=Qipengyuania algicida TaxID=1836209 RepID=A0A845AJS9_9SPHN|nr:hypothetical protein [Qipengyuania algicida]MXP29874.1 hypothetical protein [Qipengyuania algicida]
MMGGGFFSIKQKLLLVGVFLILVVVAVGTPEHPGVLVQSQQQIDSSNQSRPVKRSTSPWAATGNDQAPAPAEQESERQGPPIQAMN